MADNEMMPQQFLVQVPGIVHTTTQSTSNAQALSYALSQAFTTRNEFRWNGKLYEGEIGLKALIADLLNDPGFFDFVQALPGQPSHPVTVDLPPYQPLQPEMAVPQSPPAQPSQAPITPSQAPSQPARAASRARSASSWLRKQADPDAQARVVGTRLAWREAIKRAHPLALSEEGGILEAAIPQLEAAPLERVADLEGCPSCGGPLTDMGGVYYCKACQDKSSVPDGLPGEPEKISMLRRIVNEGQAMKVEKQLVDHFSASAIVQVWDAISDANKEKYGAMPIAQMADVAFKLINKTKKASLLRSLGSDLPEKVWRVPLFDGRGGQCFATKEEADEYFAIAQGEDKEPSAPEYIDRPKGMGMHQLSEYKAEADLADELTPSGPVPCVEHGSECYVDQGKHIPAAMGREPGTISSAEAKRRAMTAIDMVEASRKAAFAMRRAHQDGVLPEDREQVVDQARELIALNMRWPVKRAELDAYKGEGHPVLDRLLDKLEIRAQAAADHAVKAEDGMLDRETFEDMVSAPDCPWCGAPEGGNFLGQMGSKAWFRCRQCGGDFNKDGDKAESRKCPDPACGGSMEPCEGGSCCGRCDYSEYEKGASAEMPSEGSHSKDETDGEYKPVCPNCEQWQDESRMGYRDCVNQCAYRGFAPKEPSPETENAAPLRVGDEVSDGPDDGLVHIDGDEARERARKLVDTFKQHEINPDTLRQHQELEQSDGVFRNLSPEDAAKPPQAYSPLERKRYQKLDPSNAPSRPGEVPGMNQRDRQTRLDKLLDALNAEKDPAKRQQLMQRMRSLSSILKENGIDVQADSTDLQEALFRALQRIKAERPDVGQLIEDELAKELGMPAQAPQQPQPVASKGGWLRVADAEEPIGKASARDAEIEKLAIIDAIGASNAQVIDMFVQDSFPKDKRETWGTENLQIMKADGGWALVNYGTPLMFREDGGRLLFNRERYSVTTSKIQNYIALNAPEAEETDEAGILAAMEQAASAQPEQGQGIVKEIPVELEPLGESRKTAINHPGHKQTAVCRHCGEKLVDGCEQSGLTAADQYDWMTEDGDFGCDESPESNEEGTGSHEAFAKPGRHFGKDYDHVSAIMEFEQGSLDEAGILELFQYLVDTGLAWQLQGSYGRTATQLLQRGLIEPALEAKSDAYGNTVPGKPIISPEDFPPSGDDSGQDVQTSASGWLRTAAPDKCSGCGGEHEECPRCGAYACPKCSEVHFENHDDSFDAEASGPDQPSWLKAKPRPDPEIHDEGPRHRWTQPKEKAAEAGEDGGLVDDGRLGIYDTPPDTQCPQCGAGFDDIQRDLNERGKPLTMHPQLECRRCGHRWSLFPKHAEGSGPCPGCGSEETREDDYGELWCANKDCERGRGHHQRPDGTSRREASGKCVDCGNPVLNSGAGGEEEAMCDACHKKRKDAYAKDLFGVEASDSVDSPVPNKPYHDEVALEAAPEAPMCPRCKVPMKFYAGTLGYESMVCPKCGLDRNDDQDAMQGEALESESAKGSCEYCKGTGKVPSEFDPMQDTQCERCHGTGDADMDDGPQELGKESAEDPSKERQEFQDLKNRAEDLYQEWIESAEGQSDWRGAYEAFPLHNSSQADEAAEFLLTALENYASAANYTDEEFNALREDLYESIHAGLTSGDELADQGCVGRQPPRPPGESRQPR